ncbi:MAG: hypothetical protein EBR73_17380 [Rhodobacteraceae bacterium]|nr:hypothetical protein [Paracoccaceae bacterium]
MTTPTLLVTADTDGCRVLVHKQQNHSIYVGGSNVTTANGFLFDHDGTLDISLPPQESLYACSSSGTEVAYVLKVGQS